MIRLLFLAGIFESKVIEADENGDYRIIKKIEGDEFEFAILGMIIQLFSTMRLKKPLIEIKSSNELQRDLESFLGYDLLKTTYATMV